MKKTMKQSPNIKRSKSKNLNFILYHKVSFKSLMYILFNNKQIN